MLKLTHDTDIPWNYFKKVNTGNSGTIRSIKWSNDGVYCMTACSDKSIKLWNPIKGLLMKTYVGHGQDVLCVDSSFNNTNIASGSKDNLVMVWDVTTGHAIRRFREHYGAVNTVSYNLEESSVLLSGSSDTKVHIWDMKSRSNKPMMSLEDSKDSIMSLYVSDHEIITGSVDTKLRLYDIRNGKLVTDSLGIPITCCTLSRDKLSILCSCLDDSLKLLDKDTGMVLNTYKGHKNKDYKIESCFLCSDAYIVAGSEDGRLVFWDFITAKIEKEIPSHDGAVVSISYSSKTGRLLSASSDGFILWVGSDSHPDM